MPLLLPRDDDKDEDSDSDSEDDSKENDNGDSTEDEGVFIPLVVNVTTDLSILRFGLELVGFELKRQLRVRRSLNNDRFKSFYGVEPPTVRALYEDLCKLNSSTTLRDLFMTMNWFKGYDTEHVLAGRWGKCEDHIRGKVKEYGRMIQSLKSKKIKFGGFHPEEVYIISVDGVNFLTQEFRLDPSAKWYDHKSRSSGLTYELALGKIV